MKNFKMKKVKHFHKTRSARSRECPEGVEIMRDVITSHSKCFLSWIQKKWEPLFQLIFQLTMVEHTPACARFCSLKRGRSDPISVAVAALICKWSGLQWWLLLHGSSLNPLSSFIFCFNCLVLVEVGNSRRLGRFYWGLLMVCKGNHDLLVLSFQL